MKQNEAIGFIGLGMMGTPMSTCLARGGYPLFLSDADAARTAALVEKLEAQPLDAEAAAALDVLITMLPTSDIVESVLLGADRRGGWAHKLRKGATVIDMSSSEPMRSRELAGLLEGLGIGYLDAPVSGGVARATKGTLAILVGGRAEILEARASLLAQMGAVVHVGEAGAGHAAKALNNYVSAAGLVATSEALHIAERFGIDPAVMNDVLNASTGRSNTSENKVRQFMLSGTYASGFALQLINKDLKIAAGLAERVGHPMQLGHVCVSMWGAAASESSPTTDHTEMYRFVAK